MNWQRAIDDELSPGDFRVVELDGCALLVGRSQQGYFAVQNLCSHEKLPLSEANGAQARIERDLLVCPHHGAKYDPHTGRAKGLPAIRPIRSFPVKVEEQGVWVCLD